MTCTDITRKVFTFEWGLFHVWVWCCGRGGGLAFTRTYNSYPTFENAGLTVPSGPLRKADAAEAATRDAFAFLARNLAVDGS